MDMGSFDYVNAVRRQAEKRRRIELENKYNNRRVPLQPYSWDQPDSPRLESPERNVHEVPNKYVDYHWIPAAREPSVSRKRRPEVRRIDEEEGNDDDIIAELVRRDASIKRARNSRINSPPRATPLAFWESKSKPVQRESFAVNPWPSSPVQRENFASPVQREYFAVNSRSSPEITRSEFLGKRRPDVLPRTIRSPSYFSHKNLPALDRRTAKSDINEDYSRPPPSDERPRRRFFIVRRSCSHSKQESASARPVKSQAPADCRGIRESSEPCAQRPKPIHPFTTADFSINSALVEEYQGSILSGKNPEDHKIKSFLVDKVADLLVECSPGSHSADFLIQRLAAHVVRENVRFGISPTSLMYLFLKIEGTPKERFQKFIGLGKLANHIREQHPDKEKIKDTTTQKESPTLTNQIPVIVAESQELISENPKDQGQSVENDDQKPENSTKALSERELQESLSEGKLQDAPMSEAPKETQVEQVTQLQTLEDQEEVQLKTTEETPLHEMTEDSNEMKISDEQTPLHGMTEDSNQKKNSDELSPLQEIAEDSDEKKNSDEQVN